jgi:hypothetical protein
MYSQCADILWTTIHEFISQRVKTAETTVPFYQLPQKHKIPSISNHLLLNHCLLVRLFLVF